MDRRFSPPPGRGGEYNSCVCTIHTHSHPGRPYRRDSRSPRRRISRSPPPYRGRPRSRTRSRSPYPPSPRRQRLGNHSHARSPRSRSPYRQRPSIDRSSSPTKRPIERRPNSPKEPGEHDEEMPSPQPTIPEVAHVEPPLLPSSVPGLPPPAKEEPKDLTLPGPSQPSVIMEEPPQRISSPPPNDLDIIVASDSIQHPVSNERSSPITPPIQVKIERMKAEIATPGLSGSYDRRTDDRISRFADIRVETEAEDHKLSVKVEVASEQLSHSTSPKADIKKMEEPSHGMDTPRAPTVASSQVQRSPSPKASPAAPSPPMTTSSRPLPTGPSRGWGGRSPPRGPRSHIQRANAAPMSSPVANHTGPHPFTPRGPRRGGFQSGAPYSPAPGHFANRKKNTCDPKSHEPPQSLELDAEVCLLFALKGRSQ